jgi:hypothetical protein
MDEITLTELCTIWQKRLRLQDWNVKVSTCRERDMCIEGTQGSCNYSHQLKAALIQILDPSDYPPESITAQDIEVTLVHELLHLHFAALEPERDSPQHVALEQAIDLTAYALVAAYRQ